MIHMGRMQAVLIVCAVSVVLSACAAVRAPRPGQEEGLAAWDPGRWSRSLALRSDRWQQFQGVYQARWTDSLERVWRARVLVTAHVPDRMRLEILNSWGQVQGLFLLREPVAELWLVGEKTLYRSHRSAGLLEKLVGIGLPAGELAPVLVGVPPMEILDRALPRRLQDGTVVFGETNMERGFSRRYGLCPDMVRICSMELDSTGESLSIVLRYETQGDHQEIPSSITFRSAAGFVELSRTLIMRPAAVPSDTFELPPLGDAVQIVEIP